MEKGPFWEVSCTENNSNWDKLIKRKDILYSRDGDVRSPFTRDYTRLLHSLGYRRLKHKTQVFFNIENDHICTRMEHVSHVDSVSSTIAKELGLNVELTKAIAVGHDIGHAPFGHEGERVLSEISENEKLPGAFWHERNGLRFVDYIELLPDQHDDQRNLNLTYAVRDGIISHCGEVDQNGIFPRQEFIDLNIFNCSGQYEPITWEGCVVKISDKIAYIGRDIEDALCLGFLDKEAQAKLRQLSLNYGKDTINTTVIMNSMIVDICKNSTPEKGICLSNEVSSQLDEIKSFNYEYIYKHKRLRPYKRYVEMVIKSIYEVLREAYDNEHTWTKLDQHRKQSPTLVESFSKWLARYSTEDIVPDSYNNLAYRCKNKKVYQRLENESIYCQAIIDYLSGMTDRYAIKIFNELLALG